MNNNNSIKNLDMLKVLDNLYAAAKEYGCEDEVDYLVLDHLLRTSINRVAEQDSPDKKAVIKQMREYVHDKIPNLSACPIFKTQPTKVRVIMFLNYHGLESVSQFILLCIGGALINVQFNTQAGRRPRLWSLSSCTAHSPTGRPRSQAPRRT